MPAFVALLRAVNVGGRGSVTMPELCDVARQLGLRRPRTLLQSGNLLFEADAAPAAELGARLKAALAATLDLPTSILVRTAAEWRDLVEALPFPDLARSDPSHVVAMPLETGPDASRAAALHGAIVGREQVAVHDATAYIVYPDGIGRSKLTSALIERKLGTVGTCRNWRTVLKIAAAFET